MIFTALAGGVDVYGGLIEQRRCHLRGDEAHPDKPVKLEFVFRKYALQRLRRPQHGGGTNGFVRVLRVFLGLVRIGRRRYKFRAVAFSDKTAHFAKGIFGNTRGIGTHVGNKTYRPFFAKFLTFI